MISVEIQVLFFFLFSIFNSYLNLYTEKSNLINTVKNNSTNSATPPLLAHLTEVRFTTTFRSIKVWGLDFTNWALRLMDCQNFI
jgi:hypothetical protein